MLTTGVAVAGGAVLTLFVVAVVAVAVPLTGGSVVCSNRRCR